MRDGWPRSEADRAVDAIYRAHYRCLARIATLLLGNSALAEEIVQDAFVSVHHAWRHLRDADEALGYLRRAVVSRARAQSAAPSDPRSQPSVPGMPGALLIATLRGLPARQREALVLKYYADWPDPQIAAAMGISTDALNAHLRRGMSALRAFAASNWGGGT